MRRQSVGGHPHLIRLLLAPDPGGDGAGGGGATTQAEPRKEPVPLTEVKVREIIKAEGGDVQAILKMDRRNLRRLAEARDRADRAERDLAEARKKVPSDGSVVLDKDQAKDWEGYRALLQEHAIDSTESLGKRLRAGDEAIGSVARSARDAELARVAEVLDIPEDRRATWKKVAGDRKFAIEEQGEEGKKVAVAFVVEGEGKDAKRTPAADAFKDDAAALGLGKGGRAAGTAQQRPNAAATRPSGRPVLSPHGQQQTSDPNGRAEQAAEEAPLTFF